MGAPPAGEVFETDEPRKDVDPGGALPDLDITLAQEKFRDAYIEIRDAGLLNTRTELQFVHMWESEAAFEAQILMLTSATRDVASRKDYWTIQLVSAYEFAKFEDHDPETDAPGPTDPNEEFATLGITTGAGKACLVFGETSRDVIAAGTPSTWEWNLLQNVWIETQLDYTFNHGLAEDMRRTAYHELVHQFNLDHSNPPDPSKPGDQGILDQDVAAVGDTDFIELNPAQLALIRDTLKPTDS